MSGENRLPLKLTKLVLSKLDDHTMRVKDWKKLCYHEFRMEVEFDDRKFWSLIPLLLKQGYIEKVSRGIYKRTEKGKSLCESL